jgi:uncharacterized repeat protein (TIGR03806 family)
VKTPLAAFALVLAAGCGSPAPDPGSGAETLSQLGLFSDPVRQIPAPGVVPYDVISVLYADESQKTRFLYVPPGTQAAYDDSNPWTFPDGTRLIKTFAYPVDARDPGRGQRLVETRVLALDGGAWTARTYVWNDAQTEATRVAAGTRVAVSWIDAQGQTQDVDYRVPNENQCAGCHARDHVLAPLGPRTRQLNRTHDYGHGPENQIDHLASLGVLSGTIPPADQRPTLADPYGTAAIDARARSYLEGNCAHCHRSSGLANSSGLELGIETTAALDLGVCRVPTAAGPGSGGHEYDVVPGDPDASVMVFRLSSTAPELKMPQLPTVTSDASGVALIREWIAAMAPRSCAGP